MFSSSKQNVTGLQQTLGSTMGHMSILQYTDQWSINMVLSVINALKITRFVL